MIFKENVKGSDQINKLVDYIPVSVLYLIFDLFTWTDGFKARDKLSHGGLVPLKMADDVVDALLSLTLFFSIQFYNQDCLQQNKADFLQKEESIQTILDLYPSLGKLKATFKWLREYKPLFHPRIGIERKFQKFERLINQLNKLDDNQVGKQDLEKIEQGNDYSPEDQPVSLAIKGFSQEIETIFKEKLNCSRHTSVVDTLTRSHWTELEEHIFKYIRKVIRSSVLLIKKVILWLI